jgi:hypothetical protein
MTKKDFFNPKGFGFLVCDDSDQERLLIVDALIHNQPCTYLEWDDSSKLV